MEGPVRPERLRDDRSGPGGPSLPDAVEPGEDRQCLVRRGKPVRAVLAPYYSTKHALDCISQALRMELRGQGIHVTLIDPGAVETGFANREDAMLERYAKESGIYHDPIHRVIAWHKENAHRNGIGPERVVETIRRAVYADKPKNRYTVPALPFVIFVAIAKLLPSRMTDAFLRRIMKLDG